MWASCLMACLLPHSAMLLLVLRADASPKQAAEARAAAHTASPCTRSHSQVEAMSARNGLGLVKLMGRQSGFIAMQASMASGGCRCVQLVLLPQRSRCQMRESR
jgi:hypothetical protein